MRPRRRTSPVTITNTITGEIRTQPAYDRAGLRRILSSPILDATTRAVLLYPCPACGARPGRTCRRLDGTARDPHPNRMRHE